MVTPQDFIHRLKSQNKWYHAKVLLKRFHLNGHTIGFRPQTQKLEQMVPCKSTAEEVSFEWSHHRISSTDSKVRTNGTMQYCKSFILVTPISSTTQKHAKVLLKRFHLNGHTIGFHPQTQKLEQMVPCKSTAEEVSFEWSHHRISSTDSKVRTNGTMQKYC